MWYAIHTYTLQEATAAEELRPFCDEVYLPMVQIIARKKGRDRGREKRSEPMFRGYLLARVSPGQWRDVIAAKGVIGPVSSLNGPVPIRDKLVEAVRRDEALGVFDDENVGGRIKAGDILRIIDGPFEGFDLTFEFLDGDKIRGEVDMFGRSTPVSIHPQDISLDKAG